MIQLTLKQITRNHFIESLMQNFNEMIDGCESNELDLSDFGYILSRFLLEEYNNQIKGYDVDDFINGFKHGIAKFK